MKSTKSSDLLDKSVSTFRFIAFKNNIRQKRNQLFDQRARDYAVLVIFKELFMGDDTTFLYNLYSRGIK